MSDKPKQSRERILFQLELVACAALTLLAIGLHWHFLNHAGALWRDEASSVTISEQSSVREIWSLLTYDSFPLFLPLSLKLWSAICPVAGDPGLRLYGFIVGIALLVAYWFNGLCVGRKPPVLALALVAFNAVFIRWGDSLRAYGVGCVFMLAAFGLMWRMLERPTRGRFVLAALAAVLSVQTLYQNAFLLLAICLGAWAVCARRKQWRLAAQVLAVGLVSALSLAPYVPAILRSQSWWEIQKGGFDPAWIWQNLGGAMGSPAKELLFLWLGLAGVAAVVGIAGLIQSRGTEKRNSDDFSEARRFAAVTLLAGVPLFFLFIWLAGMGTQVWYYLPLLALVAACADVALGDWFKRFAEWRLVLLVLAGFFSFTDAHTALNCRMTRFDEFARFLGTNAAPDDLVVLYPWHCGLNWRRYYHGPARWTTLPPIEDHRVQRSDLFREQMQTDDPVAGLMADCARTLRAGKSIWLLGAYSSPEGDLPPIGKAPHPEYGWMEIPFELNYMGRVSYFLHRHARGIALVPMESTRCVSAYEDVPLLVARGWRE
ncbi:MAG: hypothetical protein EPO07_03035 [Verrucomicrobia bacterium]|nr:MAG: hypothetical protein EPO07_03035 [Verrucomicrobiota bacterium]